MLLKVRNFDKYQFYHNRTISSWVKIMYEITEDPKVYKLCDKDRWRFVAMIILAGKTRNRIPYDTDWIADKICNKDERSDMNESINKLIELKLLIEEPESDDVAIKHKKKKDKEQPLVLESGDVINNVIVGADTENKVKDIPDIHKLVYVYKTVKGVDPEDKLWNEKWFGRCCKPAQEILEYFKNDTSAAADCIMGLSTYFIKNNTKWSFETIVKFAPEWVATKGQMNGYK